MSQKHMLVSKKRHELSFDILSPKWAVRLNQPLPIVFSLRWFRYYSEIRSASRCVVGEAHNFSSSYIRTCPECNRFSIKFMYSFLVHSKSRLEKNRLMFVRHWNEQHVTSWSQITICDLSNDMLRISLTPSCPTLNVELLTLQRSTEHTYIFDCWKRSADKKIIC